MLLHWIPDGAPADDFPPVERALSDPDGLLAAGGDLAPERLLAAYRRGIFPWFAEGQPILWWSPNPRTVFRPDGVHVSRSLARRLRRGEYRITLDDDFDAVIAGCAAPRGDDGGTWITADMRLAYQRLHQLGHAHSVEVRAPSGELVGGLYGVALGTAFFGESMFSRATDASKIALVMLARQLRRWGFAFIDAQVGNPHLFRMGAEQWPRDRFITTLEKAVATPARTGRWYLEPDIAQENA